MKLYCIPYAGGNEDFYRNWDLGPEISVIPLLLRGRKERIFLPPYQSIEEAAQECYQQIMENQWDQERYCIFGHSMGALIAYEIYNQIYQNYAPIPAALFLSGTNIPDCKYTGRKLSELEDEVLMRELLPLGGVQAEVMNNKEVLHFFLNTLRNDLKLLEKWDRKGCKTKIQADIVVLFSKSDELIDMDSIKKWEDYTEGTCDFYDFPGGHFYFLKDNYKGLLQVLHNKLMKMGG
jgi:surfactin synthase thioesterase subunit